MFFSFLSWRVSTLWDSRSIIHATFASSSKQSGEQAVHFRLDGRRDHAASWAIKKSSSAGLRAHITHSSLHV